MINIVLATDDKFIQHCCVTITSILQNNKDVTFYIFTEGLSGENEALLKQVVQSYGSKIVIRKVDSDIVQKFPMPSGSSEHISIATYYRLFCCYLLPEEIEKVIYLDCDIVVRGNLEPLWNTDIDDYAIAAVYQHNEWAFQNNVFDRLGIPQNKGYFNAGVLLINVLYWRKNDITKKLFAFIENNYLLIKAHDQDVLNAVLHGNIRPLSPIWNYLPIFFLDQKKTFPHYLEYINVPDIQDAIIVHFVFKPKPWEMFCTHPLKSEYYKYLKYTPFKDFKPDISLSLVFKHFFQQKLLPFIIRCDVFNIRKYLKK